MFLCEVHRRLKTAPGPDVAARPPYTNAGLRINALFALLRLCAAAHNRKNWLFAGSLRAGQRAASIMSLLHTARLNGHEPYRYLKDVLERLPTQPASALADLLPAHWAPPSVG